MSPYKTDKESADCEFNNYNQPIIVPFYIKNVMLVAHVVRCRKILTYFRQVMPLCLLGDVVPSLKSHSRIAVSRQFVELFDFSMRYYMHNFSACKDIDKF